MKICGHKFWPLPTFIWIWDKCMPKLLAYNCENGQKKWANGHFSQKKWAEKMTNVGQNLR